MSRRTGAAALAILLAVMLAGCTGGHHTAETAPSSGSAARPGTASTAPSAPSASDRLQHVVVIVDENKPATSVVGNSAAPYLNSLAHAYALARQYSAITHPSLPNYLALTSGTTAGITSDCNPPGGSCLVTGPNIAQAIDRAGLTWK